MKERKISYVLKRMFMFALLFMLAQGVVTYASAATETVQAAAVKKGLKKEGNYYYYYVNGKRVKNSWKNVTVKSNGKKVTYRYYFGKNGRAYAAPDLRKEAGYNHNIVVKKIGKYYYGFNRVGRMVKNGYFNNPDKFDKNGDSYTYCFNKNGTCNVSRTKAIQKVSGLGDNAASLRKIFGKPLKTAKLNSCYGEPGDDYRLTYKYVTVTLHRYPNGKEMIFGVFPR